MGPVPTPEGVGKRQLFFSYRTVSLRLPGSYTTPKGCGKLTFNAHTCAVQPVRTILAILVAI